MGYTLLHGGDTLPHGVGYTLLYDGGTLPHGVEYTLLHGGGTLPHGVGYTLLHYGGTLPHVGGGVQLIPWLEYSTTWGKVFRILIVRGNGVLAVLFTLPWSKNKVAHKRFFNVSA